MSTNKYARIFGAAVLVGGVLVNTSCGEVARTGRSPVFLIINAIESAGGTVLSSDVVPIAADLGSVTMRVALRNPGTPTAPLGPTTLNSVTINRYRVTYIRADGRNTPGVDIPHAFDGAVTVTVPAGGDATFGFEIVRVQAKLEPPLRNLAGDGGANVISTIAEITFWGVDQTGNEVMATGRISVNFSDYANP